MKNPLKLITIILSSVIAVSTAGTVVSIATSYTKDETDALISELQTNVDKNKSDLQALISALQSEYEVKNTQLLQAIEQNTLAISALKSEYEGALAELKAADKEKFGQNQTFRNQVARNSNCRIHRACPFGDCGKSPCQHEN